jgi:hypothetical protein
VKDPNPRDCTCGKPARPFSPRCRDCDMARVEKFRKIRDDLGRAKATGKGANA